MTAKRLFVGRKTCEDRFTIINDYDGEIGVKENRSGDVLVLKHSDLNAQEFVAQLVVFLNDQNQAIVDLFDGSKYWSDKATEKIKELEKENEQLKQQIEELEFKLRTIENKELKTFKDKVFEVIDNHILEETDLRKECIENGSHYNANICRNIIDTLKLIKKELSE